MLKNTPVSFFLGQRPGGTGGGWWHKRRSNHVLQLRCHQWFGFSRKGTFCLHVTFLKLLFRIYSRDRFASAHLFWIFIENISHPDISLVTFLCYNFIYRQNAGVGQCCGRDRDLQDDQRSGQHHQQGRQGANEEGDSPGGPVQLRGGFFVSERIDLFNSKSGLFLNIFHFPVLCPIVTRTFLHNFIGGRRFKF